MKRAVCAVAVSMIFSLAGHAAEKMPRREPSLAGIADRAQKVEQARNKRWDARMQKTMGAICKGC